MTSNVVADETRKGSLTIAIPFYKDLPFLGRAIDSVLAQTHRDFVLLVVDNGGEPETEVRSFLDKYADNRIKYVRNPSNLGMAGNFNRCIDLAETELVTLLHSDDELEANYCERMVRAAKEDPEAAAFFCQAFIINDESKPVFSFPDYVKSWIIPTHKEVFVTKGDEGAASLMKGNFIMAPTLCYRRQRLGELRFSHDWKMVLDLDLYMRLLLRGERFVGLPDRCYRYRRHDENATSQFTANLLRFDEEVRIYQELARRFGEAGWLQAARVASSKTIIKLNLLYCIVNHFLRFQIAAGGAKLKFLLHRFEQ